MGKVSTAVENSYVIEKDRIIKGGQKVEYIIYDGKNAEEVIKFGKGQVFVSENNRRILLKNGVMPVTKEQLTLDIKSMDVLVLEKGGKFHLYSYSDFEKRYSY